MHGLCMRNAGVTPEKCTSSAWDLPMVLYNEGNILGSGSRKMGLPDEKQPRNRGYWAAGRPFSDPPLHSRRRRRARQAGEPTRAREAPPSRAGRPAESGEVRRGGKAPLGREGPPGGEAFGAGGKHARRRQGSSPHPLRFFPDKGAPPSSFCRSNCLSRKPLRTKPPPGDGNRKILKCAKTRRGVCRIIV